MYVNEAYELFMLDRQAMNLSNKTLKNYNNMLTLFMEYTGKKTPIEKINNDIFLKKYIGVLQKRKLASKTIDTYIKHIKAFYNFLYINDYLEQNNRLLRIRVKYEIPLPEVLTKDEFIKLLSVCNYRDKCILLLLADTGMRRKEIALLEPKDIHDTYIYVRHGKGGQGGKTRIVPISEYIYNMIIKYINEYRNKNIKYVFQSHRNTNGLTGDGIRQVIEKARKKAGINRVNAKLLRHTYATHFINNGGDIKTLQILLGHTDTRTSEIYIHLAGLLDVQKYAKYSFASKLLKEI